MALSQARDINLTRAGTRVPAGDHHARLHAGFGWQVPGRFNIAQACCGRWAEGPDGDRRVALIAHGAPEAQARLTYRQLQQRANRLSGLLAAQGVRRGDRVAIVMPQRFETAIAYIAILQMGAVAMPLSMLFGPEALQYRLADSEAVVALCDESSIASVMSVRAECPALRRVLGVGAAALRADVDMAAGMDTLPAAFEPADTAAGDPALLIYTSGTTGAPKGALIPHRAIIGNLPGFVCSQNWFGFDPARSPLQGGPDTPAVFWSPADWAWTGGLMDALLPSLYFGRPIVAFNGRFSPEAAF